MMSCVSSQIYFFFIAVFLFFFNHHRRLRILTKQDMKLVPLPSIYIQHTTRNKQSLTTVGQRENQELRIVEFAQEISRIYDYLP